LVISLEMDPIADLLQPIRVFPSQFGFTHHFIYSLFPFSIKNYSTVPR
jgi:hypothetical protein